ncbi:MAG: hypothetical protein D6732_12950 [Methanobacteriota archaeon]|nr:MAG: hypothetical protein D6732_12950 [Euryarchaeota archaeon]
MRRMIAKLQRYATGRLVFLLFLLTTIVYLVIVLYTIPAVTAQAPDLKLFDMSPGGYSAEYASQLLKAIGPTGRKVYLNLQLPIDFIYPGLFAVTYTLMLIWLFGKRFNIKSKLFFLTLIPAFAGLFDYFENIGIILMLRSFPKLSVTLVQVTSWFSITKSILTIATYILLLIGLVMLIVKPKSR